MELNVRIVSIDDSKSVLSAITVALSELDDIHVHAFLDPEDALTACEAVEFDLVLVDYTMPKLSGVDVIKAYGAVTPIVWYRSS